MTAGFLWLCRLFSSCRDQGPLSCGARASHCGGFSRCRAWALGGWISVAVAHGLGSCDSWALEHRLSSCGAWAQLLCGVWDLPRIRIKRTFPALAGRFFPTEPPRKLLFPFILIVLFPFTNSLIFCENLKGRNLDLKKKKILLVATLEILKKILFFF